MDVLKYISRYKSILLILILGISSNVLFAQGPAGPPGGGGGPGGGGQPIGVPLDSDAIFVLIGAGLIYLVYHYRHLFLKKEALSE